MLILLGCVAAQASSTTHPAHTAEGDSGEGDTGADPNAALWITAIDLPGYVIGESTLIVGPDGTSVLLDAGNDSHDADVEAAISNTLGEDPLDWLLLTHLHADHIGGVDNLTHVPDRGLLWRGSTDLVDDSNETEAMEIANLGWPEVNLSAEMQGSPFQLDLGSGALLTVLALDGRAYDGSTCEVGEDENARSLLGMVAWGEFNFVFAGDLTGGGKDTPNCEAAFLGLPELHPADVLHLSHHGIDSSSSNAWLNALLPEGAAHNALVGANEGYLTAPDADVLDRVLPHLEGGKVWTTRLGSLASEQENMVVANGNVQVTVREGGELYEVATADESAGFSAGE